MALMIAMTKAIDTVIRKHEGENELLALLTNAIALAI